VPPLVELERPKTAALTAPPCALPHADQSRWFNEQVYPHETLLKRYLRNRFPYLRDLQDIIHDSYYRMLRRHAVRPIQFAKSFLFKTAYNQAINRTNEATASPITGVGDLDFLEVIADNPGSAEHACRREEIEFLMQAIESLSPKTREVYLLRQFERVSQKEIAARLSISVKTVEAHISRANKVCERYLRSRGVLEDAP
jgi:RNA polymerase sigma factor (sigma-70 family)